MLRTEVAYLPSLSTSVDAVGEAVERLEAALPSREDSAVLCDFLEDDLREGLEAVSEVEAHFTDLLDMLRSDRLSPITLIEAGDDYRVHRRLEVLERSAAQIRRRLSQAAAKLRGG